MRIYVRHLGSGELLTQIVLEPQNSVAFLKHRIWETVSLARCGQSLYEGDTELEDQFDLEDYQLQSEYTVDYVAAWHEPYCPGCSDCERNYCSACALYPVNRKSLWPEPRPYCLICNQGVAPAEEAELSVPELHAEHSQSDNTDVHSYLSYTSEAPAGPDTTAPTQTSASADTAGADSVASLPAATSGQTITMQDEQTGDNIQHEATQHAQLCSICGHPGHVAAVCPEPLCFLCLRYGHRARNCPTRLAFTHRDLPQSPTPLVRPPASSWVPRAHTDALVSPSGSDFSDELQRAGILTAAEFRGRFAPIEPTPVPEADASSRQDAQGRPLNTQIAQLCSAAHAIQSQLGVLTHGINNIDLQIESVSHDRRCCICLTGTHDSQLLPCMHNNFCKACLEQHLSRNNHCPICSAAVRGMLTSSRD